MIRGPRQSKGGRGDKFLNRHPYVLVDSSIRIQKVDAHQAMEQAASPIHWAGNGRADKEAAIAANHHDLPHSVVRNIYMGDRRTWAIQSRLIACLMLQPKRTYDKEQPSNTTNPNNQPTRPPAILSPHTFSRLLFDSPSDCTQTRTVWRLPPACSPIFQFAVSHYARHLPGASLCR